MKTLTIAIPTYNSRADYILETLESLQRQVSRHADRVVVVVVDNASSAESAAFLITCAKRFPSMRFVRHEENLGFDRNVVRVLDSVDTDFVWFFGDDDILLAHALDDVLAAIDGNPGARVVLCRAQFFHDVAEVVERTQGTEREPQALRGAEFMYATAFTAAALSTFCVSAKAMRSTDLGFAVGTHWVHFGALILIVSEPSSSASLFIDDQLIAVRRSNSARWFANFGNQYQTGLGLLTLIRSGLDHGVEPGIYDFFRARRFANNHMDIVTLAWPLSFAARRQIHAEARKHFAGYRRYWLIDVPLLFSPNWFKSLGSAAIRLAGRVKRALVTRRVRS